jgi:hypothetical protein
MSAFTSEIGTFRTWPVGQTMSVHGGKADLALNAATSEFDPNRLWSRPTAMPIVGFNAAPVSVSRVIRSGSLVLA